MIGLCTALERARWSVWDQEAVLLPRNYLEEVNRAGALAVLLAPDPQLVERPEEALELLDGLLLAGGADIDPASYGQTPHAEDAGRGARARRVRDRADARARSSATSRCSASAAGCS